MLSPAKHKILSLNHKSEASGVEMTLLELSGNLERKAFEPPLGLPSPVLVPCREMWLGLFANLGPE